MNKRITLFISILFSLCLSAQDQENTMHRMSCTPNIDIMPLRTPSVISTRSLVQPIQTWDSTRYYRQIVILMEFSDSTFSCSDPQDRYNRIFNETGYNEGVGPGCVADYFRDQSGGYFKPVFDIFGPYRINLPAKSTSSYNLGLRETNQAVELFLSDNPDMDYNPYDWNGDGYIEQVVIVYSSFTGSEKSGFIRPTTGYMGKSFFTPDSLRINYASLTGELWHNYRSLGIGVICHEYCHCLGLPDIYPLPPSSIFSACDEWDLMDGGNTSNWGWCPPNLSAQEKMYLGWHTPIELNSATVIKGMKSVSEGGPSYIIHHSSSEFLILENRQRTGWDRCIPGQGLLITRIGFDQDAWRSNNVNITTTPDDFRYVIIPADNLNYSDWEEILPRKKNDYSYYEVPQERLYNRRLSTSAYPLLEDSVTIVNDQLTDTSVPAAQMRTVNANNDNLLGKSITNIRMAADGTISFDFMSAPTPIDYIPANRNYNVWYNIDGRRLMEKPDAPGIYINNGRKVSTK